jgi:predicted membrane channel-forming protein YqfA (hemolysin III family)
MGLLASLLSGFASGETLAAVRRARTAAIVYALAALAALCGLGFLVGAAYIWTAARYGSLAAALGFGVGFLVVAGLVLLIHRLMSGARARREAKRRKTDMKAIGVTAALALLPTLLKGTGGLKGKGGLGIILGPAVALAAYAIYRENSKPGADHPDDAGEGK